MTHPLLVGHVVALLDVFLLAPLLCDLFNLSLHAGELGVVVVAVLLLLPTEEGGGEREGWGARERERESTIKREPTCRAFMQARCILKTNEDIENLPGLRTKLGKK